MNKIKRAFVLVLSLAMVISAAACNNNPPAPAASSSAPAASSGGTASVSSEEESVDKDPLGRFEEPVTLTAVLKFSPAGPTIDADVKAPEDTYFIEKLREQCNIEIEYLWAVPPEQYDQKMSIAMTSGDLPDILKEITTVQYGLLQKNNLLADLTPALDYTLPSLREYWERIPEIFDIYNVDGKQVALPQYWDPRRSAMLMYIRQDWLDKVGKEIPTTIEELRDVVDAFVNQDPDGNGVKDTWGIQVGKSTPATYTLGNGIGAHLQPFGAYPGAWLEDGNGNLIPGVIQPEVKTGLAYLRDMYADGLIDPEFIVKDDTKNREEAIAGKIGILYDQWWGASGSPFQNLLKDPNANWVSTQIVGEKGLGVTCVPRVSIASLMALNAKAQDKAEAFIKLLNFAHLWEDYTFEDYQGNFTTKLTVDVDATKRQNRDVWTWHPTGSILDPFDINTQFTISNEAWAAKDPSKLTIGKTHVFYSQFEKFEQMKAGEIPWENTLGGFMARANPNGSWKTTIDVFERNGYVYDEKYGDPTPTEMSKGSTLTTMAEEVFMNIVIGNAPLDDFDAFVTNWKNLGGDALTEEVNQAYHEQQQKS